MTNKKGIACGGNWIVDILKLIDLYPQESTLANILYESISGGGCAFNVIINLAKFDPDLKLSAYGYIGNDPYGDFIINYCRQYKNINLDQLKRTDEEKTSYTDVFNVKATGKRTFFHYRGANKLFMPEDYKVFAKDIDIFHLGYLLLLDGMDAPNEDFGTEAAKFLHYIQSKNIKTSVDMVSENSLRFNTVVPHALKYTNYCIINDFEAEKLTGISIMEKSLINLKNLNMIAKTIFGYGVNDLVIIHFPEGAYFLSKDGVEIFQSSLDLPPDYMIGSVGAGDSFCAGILFGLHNKWSYEQTLEFAVCAGAKNLSDITSTGGITSWEDIYKLKNEFPFKTNIFG